MNIQQPTSNIEHPMISGSVGFQRATFQKRKQQLAGMMPALPARANWMLGPALRDWMFDVRCSAFIVPNSFSTFARTRYEY
jgi:hypothetical protein